MRKSIAVPLLAAFAFFFAFPAAHLMAGPVTMAWSPVGNPDNAADSSGYGAVPCSYSIGTYDVTVAQYIAFLNSNDPTGADPLALYNGDMTVNFNSGAPAGSMYSVISGTGNNPVSDETWYDAIRFANWMDNGEPVYATEPTATNNATENGSYTLLGYAATPSNGNSITRNAGAVIVLPGENEWYKAAYYDPNASSYYLYPTSSNTTPNASTPTSAPNSANYNEAVGSLTDVGAYSATTSVYGAYDMGGDVFQWNEALVNASSRGLRGGSYFHSAAYMQASSREGNNPIDGGVTEGFRLALVPEPSSIVLAIAGCVGTLALRKRLK